MCIPEMSRGQRPEVTALVLLRRAWGVGAGPDKWGESRVLVSNLWRPHQGQLESFAAILTEETSLAACAGVALAPIRPADTATAPITTAILRAKFFIRFPHLDLGGPTEWPCSGSLSSGSGKA